MADSKKTVAIPRKKHKMMCRATIEQIEANNPAMTIIDFTGSSLFQMKVKEYMNMLAKALSNNTVVKELILDEVGLGNKQAEQVAQIVSENKSITKLSLGRNKYDGFFGEEFAHALALNETLTEVDFMGSSFQDFALEAFLEAFKTNITLLKIKWRLTSRISFRLTKCITRNNNILRLKNADRDYSNLLPTGYGDSDGYNRAQTAPVPSIVAQVSLEKEMEAEPETKEEDKAGETNEEDKATEPAVTNAKEEEEEEEEEVEAKEEDVATGTEASKEDAASETQTEEPAADREPEVKLSEPEVKSKKAPLDQVKNRGGRSQSEIGTTTTAGVKGRANMFEQKKKRRSSLVGTKKRKKKLLPRALIAQIKENDPSVVDANFDNSSVFSSKKQEYCQLLHEAMKTNTTVKSISLQLCGIDNACAKHIADILAETNTLEKLNLANNRIKSEGGEYIAAALENNTSIVEMNLLTIELGNEALTRFLTMFDNNISIMNIIWRLDSRLSFRLNKALTRNKEILRRKNAGKTYFHLLPNKFRELEKSPEDAE